MPVGDNDAAREDAHDDVQVTPDPAMVLLGRAMVVGADVAESGLPADGRLPAGVDVTVAALDEWIRALTQILAFFLRLSAADLAEVRVAGLQLVEKYGGA